MTDKDKFGESVLVSEIQRLRAEITLLRDAVHEVRRQSHSSQRSVHDRLYSSVEALIGTYRELDGQAVIPPLGGWAVSPDLALYLVQLVHARQPRVVLELGSGASTLLIGKALDQMGVGQLISIEHDPVWYANTIQELHLAGLNDVVDLRYSPLIPIDIEGSTFRWYDTDSVSDSETADMILVDGPPGPTGPMARYPAGRVLISGAKQGCLVVVDDLIREDEQTMVDLWVQNFDLRVVDRPALSKGAVVLEVRS